MKKLFSIFKPSIPLALVGVVMVGSVALIELYQIQLMAQIIDVGIANQDMSVIVRVGSLMVGLALIGAVIAVLGLIIPAHVSTLFGFNLRLYLFDKIQNFSVKNVNKFSSASLVTRLTNDIDVVSRTLMTILRLLVRAPILMVSAVYMTYITNKELSYVMLVAIVILSTILVTVIQLGFSRFVFLQEKVDQLNRKIQESLVNIRVIKSFVREDFEDEGFEKENEAFYNAAMRANLLMLISNPALMAAINFATIIIVYMSSFLIIDSQILQIGDLLVFVNYLRFTMFSMMMLSFVFTMVTRSKASLIRIKEVIVEPIDITNPIEPTRVSKESGTIEFKNVSFNYFGHEADDVLSDINLHIQKGEHIGIIGSTGAGKSTLVNLLVRLVDVSQGEILLNGTDIRHMDVFELRSHFGFVPQKNVLFSGTIADNLKFGSQLVDEDAMIKATQTASIYDFINNSKDQFESTVVQGGTNFSGGQRQRLCIARALAINPNILVLDDSTSALDAATESAVMKAIDDNYPTLTLINIAQKISSVRMMDRIVVLNEGQIVGLGTHDDLLEHCTVYQEIYESQMRKEASYE
ncbi:multidrug ABC transporter permease [Erysipelothrix larvae]|uniref:Multidrug ABC transporter permease n=1 Tax=Erysipelothrix larvae TaxID=1514105 RepID=A0A0X8GZC6_9FIRM|nr:ABC transporter ATP-binding protein [Erysipelothrix larvae]AMC93154.1 multidrug ABC transporter permease [Erysipelothrix larvae]